jgi:hypothetical protein
MAEKKEALDPQRLQELLDIALQAQEDYWDAARAVELEIGVDCDEMDLTTQDFVQMPAEDLIKTVEHYWKEDDDAAS